MNPNFTRASTCAPSFSNGFSAATNPPNQIQNHPSAVNHNQIMPKNPNRLQAVEEENRKLKEEIESLKSLFHTIAINNSSSTTSTPPNKKQPRKSITPQNLKKKANPSPNHDLEAIELDHISKKLLVSTNSCLK